MQTSTHMHTRAGTCRHMYTRVASHFGFAAAVSARQTGLSLRHLLTRKHAERVLSGGGFLPTPKIPPGSEWGGQSIGKKGTLLSPNPRRPPSVALLQVGAERGHGQKGEAPHTGPHQGWRWSHTPRGPGPSALPATAVLL